MGRNTNRKKGSGSVAIQYPIHLSHMDSLEDDGCCWDFLDYSFIDANVSGDFSFPPDHSGALELEFSSTGGGVSQDKESSRKRVWNDSCTRAGTKACREKQRREKLNDRFLDLSSILEPGRSVKTEKPAILDDAIRVLNQLRTEYQELKETNEKLIEEIKNLKAEKNEFREEKLVLKADKERMEQQLKAMAVTPPAMYMPAHPAAHHAGMNKMAVYPGYGFVPMWQYLPPSTFDTSHDHELRPPAA